MNIAPARPRTRDIATENDVGVVVRRFYRAAIPDDLLGPVFEQFGVDWSVHIPKLVRYWSRALLGTRGYTGNTIRAHHAVYDVAPFGDEHLARWIELWSEAIDESYAGPLSERAKQRAVDVAQSLRSSMRRRGEGGNR